MHAWLALALILFAATGTVLRLNFADELVFGSLTLVLLIALVSRGGLVDRRLFWVLVWITAGLLFAQLLTLHNHNPLSVTTMGYWQLWRGHVAIAVGLLLLEHKKHIPSWPIVRVLQLNILFTLLQPMLGESFMAMIYPAGYIEYRSGILRTVGIFGNPNTNAFFISIYLLAIWKDLLQGNARWGKSLLIIGFAALVTTGSRTVLLTIPLLFFLLWRISIKWMGSGVDRRSAISGVAKIWLIFLVLGTLIFLSSRQADSTSGGYDLLPDMAAVTNTENLGEGYFRAIATAYSFGHFLDNPILGLGYGSYGSPASFAWPSPYLESDGLIFEEDSRGLKLSQLDVLIPVVLAESGSIGIFFWLLILFSLLRRIWQIDRYGGTFFCGWMAVLFIATLTGPGFTHPIVVALIPFFLNWLIKKKKYDCSCRCCSD